MSRTFVTLFALLALSGPVFAQAKEIPAETVRRLFHEGNALMEKGDHAAAHAKYEEALKIEPEAKGPLFNGGLAAALLGKHDVALRHFGALKKLVPGDAQVRAKLVQSYAAAGVLDCRVRAGTWLTSWNAASHMGYWQSGPVATVIARKLALDWAAVNSPHFAESRYLKAVNHYRRSVRRT